MPIVNQPIDATLQFGDQFANINHQGVLTSNINNTPILGPTFPTTNTGNSLCHAHYTEPTTNALQFLNASGSGLGGHKFYTSNLRDPPVNTATIDINGITVERNDGYSQLLYDSLVITNTNSTSTVIGFPTSGTNQVFKSQGITSNIEINVDTPTITLTDDAYNGLKIILDTASLRNNTQKTVLDLLANQLTLGNTPDFFTSVLKPESLIFTDTLNELELQCSGEGLFLLNQGAVLNTAIYPNIIQIVDYNNDKQQNSTSEFVQLKNNLGTINSKLTKENLTITDISNNISILSSTDLKFNNVTLNTDLLKNNTQKTLLNFNDNNLTFTNANNTLINFMDPTITIIRDNANNLQNYITPSRMIVNDGNLDTSSTINAGLLQIGDPTDLTRISPLIIEVSKRNGSNSSLLNKETLTITNTLNTTNSVLSSDDIKFNNVSLKSQVATNTTDIATINTNISSLNNLIIKQTVSSNQGLSLAIFADGKPAIAPTTTISQQYAFTPSWYFKNTFPSNNKINWYFGSPIGLTVSNLLGVYMNMFSASMTSNDLCPFITIYTQPQVGDSTFYHSKRTYLFNQSITPIINTRYFNFANISGTCPTPQIPAPSNLINMQLSTVSGTNVGPFLPTELILYLTIGSNSVATINTVEFAINKFGFMTSTGSQEINLISS